MNSKRNNGNNRNNEKKFPEKRQHEDFPTSSNINLADLKSDSKAIARINIDQRNDYTNHNDSRVHEQKNLDLAAQWILRAVLSKAWRNRRAKIENLNNEIAESHAITIEVKNDINACNTVLREEQRRNDIIVGKLNATICEIHQNETLCMELNAELARVEQLNIELKNELHLKNLEEDELTKIMEQTKRQLYRAFSDQRDLWQYIAREQRKYVEFEIANNALRDEYKKIEDQLNNIEYHLKIELDLSESTLHKIMLNIFEYQEYARLIFGELNDTANSINMTNRGIRRLETEVQLLKQQSFSYRFANAVRNNFKRLYGFTGRINNIFDWFLIHLLPTVQVVF